MFFNSICVIAFSGAMISYSIEKLSSKLFRITTDFFTNQCKEIFFIIYKFVMFTNPYSSH